MLKSFVFVLCLLCPLYGSTIPNYQIAAITERNLETFNGARYEVFAGDLLQLHSWELGDNLQLQFVQTTLFWNPVFFYHDLFHRGYILSLVNLTKNNARVAASLSFPPETPAMGTYEIMAIDRINGFITLSNATIWSFDLTQLESIPNWVPGQIVLIGVPLFISHNQDAFFLNVETQNVLTVREL